MTKYTSEASVFVPKSMREASPIYISKVNERSKLTNFSAETDEQSEWICTKLNE